MIFWQRISSAVPGTILTIVRSTDIMIVEEYKMEINELLSQKGMSKYRLSKESGVAQTTIMDICSGKARIEKCAGDTLYRIYQNRKDRDLMT